MTATLAPADLLREVVSTPVADLQEGDMILPTGDRCSERGDYPAAGCEHVLEVVRYTRRCPSTGGIYVAGSMVPGSAYYDRPGDRLLVARIVPELDVRDEVAVAAVLPHVPLMCGPAGNLARGGDLNSDWTCARARAVFHWSGRQETILDEAKRVSRLRSERRQRALAVWVRREVVRHRARVAVHGIPECGHAAVDRRYMTVEEALPACTC